MLGQTWIPGHQGGRLVAGRGDHVAVAEQREQLQLAAATRLRSAQDVALVALRDVQLGQREAVRGGRHRIQSFAGRRAGR